MLTPDLQRALGIELARYVSGRRAELVAVDDRLAALVDRLVAFTERGGKRLRPEFVWWGWRAGGGPGIDTSPAHAAVQLGAAVELIQACALLHDDLIDRSDTRRGAPSVHRAVAKQHSEEGLAGDPDQYGLSAALLLGDIALAWADDLFTQGAHGQDAVTRTLPVWQSMRAEVLAGQLLDLVTTVAVGTDPAAEAADAMIVNRYKTAAYTVERPLHLGAALADAPPVAIAALRAYGADVGVAFQLRDDLLGVYGDPAVTGKPAGDDLVEGKRTLLLATARARLSGDDLAELDSGVGSASADPSRLAQLIAATGAPEFVETRISELVDRGTAALDRADERGAPVLPELAVTRLRGLATLASRRER